jgi:hypothetical protein
MLFCLPVSFNLLDHNATDKLIFLWMRSVAQSLAGACMFHVLGLYLLSCLMKYTSRRAVEKKPCAVFNFQNQFVTFDLNGSIVME